MRIDDRELSKIDSGFCGYLKGNRVDEFFEEFGINFSAGHWCAGDFSDRFMTRGYNIWRGLKSDIVSQIQRVREAGIKGIEFQSDVFVGPQRRKDKKKVETILAALRMHGLLPANMGLNLFYNPRWRLGSLTNPDEEVREEAVTMALTGIDIAREIGCSSVSLWPGMDGWDYCFEADYSKSLNRFIDGCVTINEEAKKHGLPFGVEAKLHEPREDNMILPTSHLAMLVARDVNRICGGRNMGIVIDYGHEQMYAVNPAFTLTSAKVFDVPVVNFHINTSKVHSNDEDRVAGTGDMWRMCEFCYAAILTGYSGWFSEDQFTYRMNPVKAMSLSKELFANIMKKALLIYKDRKGLEDAQSTGDAGSTIDAVKEKLI